MSNDNLPPGVTDKMIDDHFGPDDCEECEGSGKVDCPVCDGTGNDPDNTTRDYCGECDGEGKVECEDCDGTGVGPTDEQRRYEAECEKADRDRDEWKDEGRWQDD